MSGAIGEGAVDVGVCRFGFTRHDDGSSLFLRVQGGVVGWQSLVVKGCG